MKAEDDFELDELFYTQDSSIHGKGLFARRAILKGEYMGEYDGPNVSENGMHVLWVEDEEDSWIGRDGKNLLRYINHSTQPLAEFAGFELYALRDIDEGEEITIDYGEEP